MARAQAASGSIGDTVAVERETPVAGERMSRGRATADLRALEWQSRSMRRSSAWSKRAAPEAGSPATMAASPSTWWSAAWASEFRAATTAVTAAEQEGSR